MYYISYTRQVLLVQQKENQVENVEELSSIGAVILNVNYVYENLTLIDWIQM